MKKIIRSKWFIIGTTLAVVVGLVLGFALPGFAAGDPTPKTNAAVSFANNVIGSVTSITAASFDVKNKSGANETITVNSDTKFYKMNNALAVMPGPQRMPMMPRPNEKNVPPFGNQKPSGTPIKPITPAAPAPNAKFEDLKVNDNVVVHFTVDTANNVTVKTAGQVIIMDAVKLPAIETVRGTIKAIGTDSITVHPAQGEDVVVKWDANTHITLQGFIAPAVGQYAIVVYKTDAATKINTAQMISVTAAEPVPPAKGDFPKFAPGAPRPAGKST